MNTPTRFSAAIASVALALVMPACSTDTNGIDSGRPRDGSGIDASNADGSNNGGDGTSNGDGSNTGNDGSSNDDASSGDDSGTSGDGSVSGDGGGDAGMRCTVTPSVEPFRNPMRNLHWRATTTMPFPGIDQVCSTPVVADIVPTAPDEPPTPEVAFMTFECMYNRNVLRVISGRAPHRLLWSQNGAGAPNDMTAPFTLRWDGHPAVGDLDGNLGNGLEIVVVTAAGGLIAYRANGTVYWQSTARPIVSGEPNPSISIADLNANGVPEVIVAASVFNGRTGALVWQGSAAHGVNAQGPLSAVADIDGDGRLEVIAGGAVYESDGRVRFMMGDGFSAVGDILDARGRSGRDGAAEVVRVSAGNLYILDGRTGLQRWTSPLLGAAGAGGAPTIADFDGDGQAEIGVAGATRYTLFDPGCVVGTAGCLMPNVRWATVTEDASSAVTSSTVFDFNGDGASEVVYNDEEHFMVLDGRTGRIVFSDWNPSQTRTEQPIVADADGDGHADIVFGANTCAAFAGDTIPTALRATERIPGLEIWSSGDGSWVGARNVWNEHAYHIDNINDDGSIPRVEPPSWRTHNTFRLNRARDNVLYAPDLGGAPEMVSCSGATAMVCVNVRNSGDARSGIVRVGVYNRDPAMGGTVLGMASTTAPIDVGMQQRVCVSIPAPSATITVFVRVDDASAERECNESNNTLTVTVTCEPG